MRPRSVAIASMLAAAAFAAGQTITSPRQHLGHDLGEDYWLPTYRQLSDYWAKLDLESDRLTVVSIGKTEEGREQLMGIVTSPANHQRLDRYREIARKLALAEGMTDDDAKALAKEGRAVVWIDGGLHATEVLGPTQLMETLYQMVSMNDEETLRILEDVVILFVHANPDGMDLVADWYMRNSDPQKRSYFDIPRLYQKYIGHDNNRDFYASTQKESENMNRVLYREWFPQVLYNHHQTGPPGTIMFAPPFRDPFNHHYDPLIVTGVDLVGSAMHHRFMAEGKPGTVRTTGAPFSTWWNGGLRTTAYFHNIIGLLTETTGSPNPMNIPLQPERLEPKGELPFPVMPQKWHFRQSVDYSVTANRAVLDLASRHREQFLYNIYKMGSNSIVRGSRDSWTHYPSRIAAVAKARADRQDDPLQHLLDPSLRDPRGFILPADQPDFLTATKFVNALIETGVVVHRATADFQAGGRSYPGGSYVVKAAQAFRPHVMDMFEPQDHPNDFKAAGGAPTPPYDSAGWTLAFQMGVQFDRVLDAFDGPFERIDSPVRPVGGALPGGAGTAFVIDPRINDGFALANRLLAARVPVLRSKGDGGLAPGSFVVRNSSAATRAANEAARDLGISMRSSRLPREATLYSVRQPRIGLWDRYGGSMPSGWTRWLFEQFSFPYRNVFAKELDEGRLRDKFDVLVFVSGAISENLSARPPGGQSSIPLEFQHMLGSVTADKTVPKLREFLEAGGTVVAIGGSTSIARHLGLPVRSHLQEIVGGKEQPLPPEKYYVPGSLLRMKVDTSHPAAYGLPGHVDAMFDNSPVFRLTPEAVAAGARVIAWFDSDRPLRSGWAWGQHYLRDGITALSYPVGRGMLYLYGPEITFRAQPHGTFKLLFNPIMAAGENSAGR